MVTQDQVVLLLVNGMTADAAEAWCRGRGMLEGDAKAAVAQGRQRITVAATYTRDEQIGRAVMRLDDLYAKSIAGKDIRTALQAQRELNRLMSLYSEGPGCDGDSSDTDSSAADCRRSLDLVNAHLLPLKLADPAHPIEEHARIAADIIRSNGLAELCT